MVAQRCAALGLLVSLPPEQCLCSHRSSAAWNTTPPTLSNAPWTHPVYTFCAKYCHSLQNVCFPVRLAFSFLASQETKHHKNRHGGLFLGRRLFKRSKHTTFSRKTEILPTACNVSERTLTSACVMLLSQTQESVDSTNWATSAKSVRPYLLVRSA